MPIQCANCRTWNRDGAAHCSACGKPLGAAPKAKPASPPSPQPAATPHPVRGRRKPLRLKKVTGEVRNLQERQEARAGGQSVSIRTFVVESYDTAGNLLYRVPVEMRGRGFDGVLSQGDTVEIAENWREGQTLRANKLRNVSTGGSVSVHRVDWVLLFILLIITAVIVYFLIRSGAS